MELGECQCVETVAKQWLNECPLVLLPFPQCLHGLFPATPTKIYTHTCIHIHTYTHRGHGLQAAVPLLLHLPRPAALPRLPPRCATNSLCSIIVFGSMGIISVHTHKVAAVRQCSQCHVPPHTPPLSTHLPHPPYLSVLRYPTYPTLPNLPTPLYPTHSPTPSPFPFHNKPHQILLLLLLLFAVRNLFLLPQPPAHAGDAALEGVCVHGRAWIVCLSCA